MSGSGPARCPATSRTRAALHAAGAFGFKCFTVDSGVPEFPPLDAAGLEQAAAQLAGLGAVLLVHAEDAGCIAAAAGREYAAFLRSRPDEAERRAVALVIDVARRTGVRAHILHVSSASVLPLLAAARADGVPVTAETCPHYLALAAEDIPAGATQFKCCPPIRGRRQPRAAVGRPARGHAGLRGVGSLAVPARAEAARRGRLRLAWGGIASLQLALPVVWTAGRERGCTLADIAGGWRPARPRSRA